MLSKSTYETISGYVPESNIKQNENLAGYTSFKIGGDASCLVDIQSEKQLCDMAHFLNAVEYPYFVLGNGSNTLVADTGFDGIVLHIGKAYSDIELEGNTIIAEAGAMLARVARVAQENGLSGLEFAAGIPGSVGGGVVMNAGAYGGEMSQVVSCVRAVSQDGEVYELSNHDLEFGYRQSVLRNNRFIVSKVVFELTPGDKDEIRTMMDDYNARRRDKQPLDLPSAGSTFKRPEGYFAGELIMNAGMRGFQIGGARVSDKHCGFVVNVGNASAEDVLDVIAEVQERVMDRFKVHLEPEIVVLK